MQRAEKAIHRDGAREHVVTDAGRDIRIV
jgi:hypothetical protein